MSRVSSPRKRSAFLWNALAVVTVVALMVIAVRTDFGLLWAHAKAIPPALFLLLLCLQLVTQLALNYQWFRLCKTLGLKASFMRLLVVNAYGTLMDAASPGEKVGGELARVVQLNNRMGFTTNQSTSLVTIQKSLSLSSLVILNMAAVITLSDQVPLLRAVPVRLLLIGILLALAALLVYALFFTEALNARVQSIRSEKKAARWVKQWMEDFTRDTRIIGEKPKEWLMQFLLSLIIWALFPLKLYLIVSQSVRISLFVLFAITFISYFAAMIPLLPGGLGTFEAAMSGMLIAYSLSAEAAMAISLVFRFITFWFVVLVSAVLIVLWKILEWARKTADEI